MEHDNVGLAPEPGFRADIGSSRLYLTGQLGLSLLVGKGIRETYKVEILLHTDCKIFTRTARSSHGLQDLHLDSKLCRAPSYLYLSFIVI